MDKCTNSAGRSWLSLSFVPLVWYSHGVTTFVLPHLVQAVHSRFSPFAGNIHKQVLNYFAWNVATLGHLYNRLIFKCVKWPKLNRHFNLSTFNFDISRKRINRIKQDKFVCSTMYLCQVYKLDRFSCKWINMNKYNRRNRRRTGMNNKIVHFELMRISVKEYQFLLKWYNALIYNLPWNCNMRKEMKFPDENSTRNYE